jgi:hypothetical protein
VSLSPEEEEDCSDPEEEEERSDLEDQRRRNAQIHRRTNPPRWNCRRRSRLRWGRRGREVGAAVTWRPSWGQPGERRGERSERGSAGIMGWDKESMGALGQVVPCAGPSGRDGRPHSINIVLRQALHSNVKTKFHPISLYIYIH